MSPEEMRYEIHDKEMLAVVRALQKWQGMLLSLQAVSFVVITDHCALKYFIIKQLLNSQQAKWADIVTDYNFKITYCSEIANIVTDTLTRKHDKLITQKEKNIAACTQLFLDLNCVIASVEEGSEKQTELTENPYQLVNQILQANWTHDSLNQYCQTAKKE